MVVIVIVAVVLVVVVAVTVVDPTCIQTFFLSTHASAHRSPPPSYALQNTPLDLYDLHFCARRKGLPKRLKDIAGATDEQLWLDVGRRYERLEGLGNPRETFDVSGALSDLI